MDAAKVIEIHLYLPGHFTFCSYTHTSTWPRPCSLAPVPVTHTPTSLILQAFVSQQLTEYIIPATTLTQLPDCSLSSRKVFHSQLLLVPVSILNLFILPSSDSPPHTLLSLFPDYIQTLTCFSCELVKRLHFVFFVFLCLL